MSRRRKGRAASVLPWSVIGLTSLLLHAAPPVAWQTELALGWRSGDDVVRVLPDGREEPDATAMFSVVWQALPDVVEVWPTENYVYWRLAAAGRDWRGNVRLAPGSREKGELHFAVSEWQEFPSRDYATRPKAEAVFRVLLPGRNAFEWLATYENRQVTFRLHQVTQTLPPDWPRLAHETFVMRTADESGLMFLLLFDEQTKRFRWLLDEREPVPERWRELEPGLWQGRRTGFVFRVEDGPPSRRRMELVAVRAASVARNDYYDGPFDQLADNYAEDSSLQRCLEAAYPELRGCLDAWGRYTDERHPARIAIAPYAEYYSEEEAIRVGRTAASEAGGSRTPEEGS